MSSYKEENRMKNPLVATVVALLRRFATLAGSAVLAFIAENVMGWAQQSFLVDPKTAVVWPLAYFVVEFVQKYWREHKAAKAVPEGV
jgi:hypothetical protein